MNLILRDIALSFSSPPWQAALAVVLAVLFSAYIYRRTNPAASRSLRLTLAALRAAALALIIAALFDVVAELTWERRSRPVLAVAVDQSASMTLADRSGPREEQVRSLLNHPLFEELRGRYELRPFVFSSHLQPAVGETFDSLRFKGDETDLSAALEALNRAAEPSWHGVLLISDGCYTRGGNPVRRAAELKLPVYTVGVGSEEPIADLAVARVETAPYVYAGRPTTVRVALHSQGFGALSLPLTLAVGGEKLGETRVDLPPSPADAETELSFTPASPGRQQLKISVPVQSGEATAVNNRRTIYIEVLKAKLKLLLIAGSITPDISFLRRNLDGDRGEVSLLLRRAPAMYDRPLPSALELDQTDLFIFYDFPTGDAPRELIDALQASLERRPRPILLICGGETAPPVLARFRDYIPIDRLERMPQEFAAFADPGPLGFTHPLAQLSETPSASQAVWRALPPLTAAVRVRSLMPGSEIAVFAKASPAEPAFEPLIISRRGTAGKSIAVAANQLWRWHLTLAGRERSEPILGTLLHNFISWLETPAADRQVVVSSDKGSYGYGESPRVTVFVYDERLRPVAGAAVEAVLSGPSSIQRFILSENGERKYELELPPPKPGDWRLQVSAKLGERTLGSDETRFSVGEYTAETAQPTAQLDVLRRLAELTGGAYVPADSFAALGPRLKAESVRTSIHRSFELWNRPLLPAIVLLLLFTEWLVRRRRGMV